MKELNFWYTIYLHKKSEGTAMIRKLQPIITIIFGPHFIYFGLHLYFCCFLIIYLREGRQVLPLPAIFQIPITLMNLLVVSLYLSQLGRYLDWASASLLGSISLSICTSNLYGRHSLAYLTCKNLINSISFSLILLGVGWDIFNAGEPLVALICDAHPQQIPVFRW